MPKTLKRPAKASGNPKKRRRRISLRQAAAAGRMSFIIDDAKNAGLLDGEKSEHITARTTPALLEEARRQTGITSKTVLVEVALAALALPDPVAKFMKEHRGELGEDHTLDY